MTVESIKNPSYEKGYMVHMDNGTVWQITFWTNDEGSPGIYPSTLAKYEPSGEMFTSPAEAPREAIEAAIEQLVSPIRE